jgi:hypothetical protein
VIQIAFAFPWPSDNISIANKLTDRLEEVVPMSDQWDLQTLAYDYTKSLVHADKINTSDESYCQMLEYIYYSYVNDHHFHNKSC